MPFYGATYGGASWNSFTDANNLTSGCYLDGVRTTCQSVLNELGKGNAVLKSVPTTTGTIAEFFNQLGALPQSIDKRRWIDDSSHNAPHHNDDASKDDVIVTNTDLDGLGHWEYWTEYVEGAASGLPERPQDPIPAPAPTPTPYVKPCDRNGVKKNQEELDDLAGNLGGQITYTKPGKPDSKALITDLKGNPTLGELETRLRKKDWSPIWGNLSPEHWEGEDWKRKGQYGNWYHITAYPMPSDKIIDSQIYLDQRSKPAKEITIHCDNGNPQNPFHER